MERILRANRLAGPSNRPTNPLIFKDFGMPTNAQRC
jgi:hypothetical protein